MRTLVKSLQRLYAASKITAEKIREMKDAGTITQEEMEYILEE